MIPAPAVLSIDYATRKVVVTTDAGIYVFNTRSEAFEAFPELRPAPPSAADERRLVRMEQRQRVQGGVGFSRSGRRS